MSGPERGAEQGPPGTRTTAAEWVLAALGGALVVLTIGYLAYDAVTAPSLPADVRVAVTKITPAPHKYIVQFQARNVGSGSAVEVEIVGELRQGAVVIERHRVLLQTVPPGSQREGGLYFTHDPGRGALLLRAEGYGAP